MTAVLTPRSAVGTVSLPVSLTEVVQNLGERESFQRGIIRPKGLPEKGLS